MDLLVKIGIIVLGFIVILFLIYFFLLLKLKKLNTKFHKYYGEKELKEKNIRIIYQPSRHKTTNNVAQIIKEKVLEKGYGINISTLSKDEENFNDYKYVVLVLPVYFGEVHNYIKDLISKIKKPNLIIVYIGVNKDSNHENELLKKQVNKKYSMTKIMPDNIESVENFIEREVI